MEQLNTKKLSLFLGNCLYAAHGEWITLPMEESKLKEVISNMTKKYGELIISDYCKEKEIESMHISQYADIFEINYVLQQPTEYIALYIHGDEDITFANEMWAKGEYIYIPNVINTEELGEAIAKIGLIKGISQELMDLGYIDYHQIGTDFECNGITLYKGIGAIGQISKQDYLKWIDKPINSKSKSLMFI